MPDEAIELCVAFMLLPQAFLYCYAFVVEDFVVGKLKPFDAEALIQWFDDRRDEQCYWDFIRKRNVNLKEISARITGSIEHVACYNSGSMVRKE